MDIALGVKLFIAISVVIIVFMQLRKSSAQGWKTWIAWNLATDIGLIFALIIFFYALYFISQGFEGSGQVIAIEVLPVSAISGLMGGFLLGLFQWLIIRSKISRASRWIWATSLGWAISVSSLPFVIISNFQATLPLVLTILALSLLIFPLAQWLMLRREVHKAGWWVVANVIGWVGAGIAATLLANIGLNEVVGLFIGFTLPGVITGFALLYLFEGSKVQKV